MNEHTLPEVSVILPVFNGAKTIERAVRSILNQSLQTFELLVLDDGSTDDTAAIVQGIRDPRLRLIRHRHQGIVATANLGTTLSQAPLIARMDADDFSYPQRLEKQLHFLRNQHLDAVGCRIRIVCDDGEPSPTMSRYARWINEETLETAQISALRFVELPLVNPTILARRTYFELGFSTDDVPEDYDLMLRAAALGMQFGKVDDLLFDWADHPHRLTRTDSRYSLNAFMRCRRFHLLSGLLADVRQVDLWGMGKTGKPWLQWLHANNIHVRRAYDINPRQIGQQIHRLRIEHPAELATPDGTLIIIAVGADHARQAILPQLQAQGYIAGKDAWFVA